MPKGVYKRPSFKERLLSKVKDTSPNKCWEWTGATNRGYGRTSMGLNHCIYAHRLSYEVFNNTRIPEGMEICHSCDNSLCINPKHLSVGTRETNARDSAVRNRIPFGERHCWSKLNNERVCFIRKMLHTKKMTGPQLARKFGVYHSAIYNAANGKTWRRVK